MSSGSDLFKKIKDKKAKIGIIGVGYVGSALAKVSYSSGFEVLGFTRKEKKAKEINDLGIKNYKAATNISLLTHCDIICICVPTPIHPDKSPDLEPFKSALLNITHYLRRGQLIIIESTIAPGTTRNFALKILLESGLKIERDFFLSFSPERIDPGNEKITFEDMPKVVAGFGKQSTRLVEKFYKSIVKKVVVVSNLETAEMSKILENTFRLVNISLINELTKYTNNLGINMWEVITAASTKPFGFLPHYPGPGVGGHCIPVDPYYLLNDAKKRGISLKIIEHAGLVNDQQPVKVVNQALEILKKTNGKNGEKKKNKILLIGVSYKPDISDIRESPALKIWELFKKHGHSVSYHDPHVSHINGFVSQKLSRNVINQHDLIIITTNHTNINYQNLIKYKKTILDTRNVFNGHKNGYVIRL
ncbi:MAG: nucleotide sugar dehydrogenase [Candidatus Levybacteria bacterium]|nr:nucleotide sugar dehydrogenase [Candidatus Levybacteria bacterium]